MRFAYRFFFGSLRRLPLKVSRLVSLVYAHVFILLKMQKSFDQILGLMSAKYGISINYEILDAKPRKSEYLSELPPIGNKSHYRQNLFSEFEMEELENKDFEDFKHNLAFVIQGPLDQSSSTLFDVIELYLQRYPGITIILSLWKQDSFRIQENIVENPRVEIILNEEPSYAGFSNINKQILSTKTGLTRAQSLKKDFVLKLRTDQHLLGPAALETLFNYKNIFIDQTDTYPRILGVSRNTFKYRLYSFSDMFQFGFTESLLNYWDVEFDNRTQKDLEDLDISDWLQYSKAKLVETYLQLNYMNKIGIVPKYTLQDSLCMYSKLFVIVSENELGLVWNKYSLNSKPWQSHRTPNKFHELSFSEWLYLSEHLKDI